jgi:hypothetical protein
MGEASDYAYFAYCDIACYTLKLIIIVPWNLAGRDLGHADLIGARSELRLFSASELLPQERPESSPLY